MYQHVNATDFEDAFRAAGRYDQFSWKAKQALFEYLEQYEEDIGEEIELDVIALCCEFDEFPSALDAATNLYISGEECETEEEALAFLRDHTIVIPFDDGIIVQAH